MSNSFVGTKARQFKQSLCRARITRQPGFFGFQILNSLRSAVDGNFAPDGWPTGVYDGPNGPYVGWQDFTFPDPRDASFITPSATQIKSDGWLHETWTSSLALFGNQSFGYPTPKQLRIGTTDHSRLHKSSSPVGIFNSETDASGFKVRRGALVLSQGFTYDTVTSTFGVTFPTGISHDQWQELKIYDAVGGTLTKHTLQNNALYFQAANFSGTLNAPTSIQEYFPSRGDPPRTFKTNEFVYGRHHITATGAGNFIVAGTVEVLIFWFYLRTADLPTFPLEFNTARDFFFVG